MATGGGGPPPSPADSDDLLAEILVRLSPAPSSLPRASLVCKRWRRLVSDPGFLARFRARHRRGAPLLGFLSKDAPVFSFADPLACVSRGFAFVAPVLDPPDRVPSGRLSLRLADADGWDILGCRHGLLLLFNRRRLQVLVWDPVTAEQRRVAVPDGFAGGNSATVFGGAVLLAPGVTQQDGAHAIPFLVVLVGTDGELTRAFASVYSSENGIWGDLISTPCPSAIPVENLSTLVGCSLYWLLEGGSMGILELDLDRQCLTMIDMPLDLFSCRRGYWAMLAEAGVLGFLCLANHSFSAQLWKRKIGSDGVAHWVPERTIELDKLLSLNSKDGYYPRIVGFAEENNALFVKTNIGNFMIQLESMQFKKLSEPLSLDNYHPFASVYTAGI